MKNSSYYKMIVSQLIFPLLPIIPIVMRESTSKRRNRGIFLILWIMMLWTILVFLGETNFIVNILFANLAIMSFLGLNFYSYIDFSEFSDDEIQIIKHFPLSSFISFVAFGFTLLIVTFPKLISPGKHTFVNEIINTPVYYSIPLIVLFLSWLGFVFADNYEIFNNFPKYKSKRNIIYSSKYSTHEKAWYLFFIYTFILIVPAFY